MRRSPQFLQRLLPFWIIRIELQYPLHNSPRILHLSFRRQCLRQVHSDGAISPYGKMFLRAFWSARMARHTFLVVVAVLFLGARFVMRVMARDARKRAACFAFTLALRQRLEVAGRARLPARIIQQKIMNVFLQIIARPKIAQMSSRLQDCHVAFQMALHAH